MGVHTDAVETQLKTIGFILIKRCAHGVCAYTSSFDTHSSLYPPRRRQGDSAGISEKLKLRRPLVRQNRQVSVSFSEKVSDPRPRVTRPAPAGHTTCARGSRDLRPRVADFLGEKNGNRRHWIAFGRSTFASHRATPPCAPCMEGTDGLRGAALLYLDWQTDCRYRLFLNKQKGRRPQCGPSSFLFGWESEGGRIFFCTFVTLTNPLCGKD